MNRNGPLGFFLGAQPNRGTSIPLCRETQWVIGIECNHEGLSGGKGRKYFSIVQGFPRFFISKPTTLLRAIGKSE